MDKMSYQDIKHMLLLDVMRNTENCIPFPTCEDFGYLEDLVQSMVMEGLLITDGDCYRISNEGKKSLLMFDSERKTIIGPIEKYKSVMIDGKEVDARIPVMSYLLMFYQPLEATHLMRGAIFSVMWEDLLNNVLTCSKTEQPEWQKMISQDTIYDSIGDMVDVNSWKTLGKTEIEARTTCKWLLNPYETGVTLTQITRN